MRCHSWSRFHKVSTAADALQSQVSPWVASALAVAEGFSPGSWFVCAPIPLWLSRAVLLGLCVSSGSWMCFCLPPRPCYPSAVYLNSVYQGAQRKSVDRFVNCWCIMVSFGEQHLARLECSASWHFGDTLESGQKLSVMQLCHTTLTVQCTEEALCSI